MNAIFVALRSASATNPVRLGDKGNGTPESKAEAKRRHAHLNDGHIPDIYRTGPPHTSFTSGSATRPSRARGPWATAQRAAAARPPQLTVTRSLLCVRYSTLEYLRGKVLGQKQMGAPSDPPLDRRTGVGRVDPRPGDYADAFT